MTGAAHDGPRDRRFWRGLLLIAGGYAALLAALLMADAWFLVQSSPTDDAGVAGLLASPEIRRAVWLTLVCCSISTVLALSLAVPIGYLLARRRFTGKAVVDTLIDAPLVLPPLALGLSLLILFQTLPAWLGEAVVYQTPAVILAQLLVGAALAIRTVRATFEQIDPRLEQVALTLGASRLQAMSLVALPEARGGLVAAGALAWARSLGEFGPVLVFAGATRGKTEVLATTVFLEMSVGNLRGAVAVSLAMIALSAAVLAVARFAVSDRG